MYFKKKNTVFHSKYFNLNKYICEGKPLEKFINFVPTVPIKNR